MESMVKDLGELFEHWGEHDRLGLHPRAIARYVVGCLDNLRGPLLAVHQTREEFLSDDARLTKMEEGKADGSASEGLSFLDVASSEAGPQP